MVARNETHGDGRRTLRKAVRLRDRGSTRFEIDVIDLSPTGFRAETAYRLHPGTLVWISLPGLASLEAEVAWQEGEKVGCRFSNALHPAVFDHIVKLGAA